MLWARSKVDSARDVKLSFNVRLANSWAEIKPTAPLPVFDKENSIEFPLDLLHYIYNYYVTMFLFSYSLHIIC